MLPIDDADLQVERGIEVLTALRTLSHPRLVFLLTGDSGLFESLLRLAMIARLRRPLGSASGALLPDEERALHDDANRLAYEFFERVLPPDHRCKIRGVLPEERLELATAPGDPPVRVLDLLGEMTLGVQEPGALNVVAVIKGCPSYGMILPDRLRAMINLDRLLRKNLEGITDPRERAVVAARRIWRDAVRHEPLSIVSQRALLDLFHHERSERLEFRGSDLLIRYSYAERSLDAPTGLRCALRTPRTSYGSVASAEGRSERIDLPHRLVSALQFTHDIATLAGKLSALDNAILTERNFPSPATSYLLISKLSRTVSIRWPLPNLNTFRGVFAWIDATFALLQPDRGGRLVAAAPTVDEGMRSLLTALLSRLHPQYRDRTPDFLPQQRAPGLKPAEPWPWDEIMLALGERVEASKGAMVSESLESIPSTRHDETTLAVRLARIREDGPIGAWVLDGLILLAAPEYGLSKEHARQFLRAFNDVFASGLSDSSSIALYVRERAKALRTEAMRRAIEGESSVVSVESMVEAADALGGPDHPWFNDSLGPTERNITRSVDSALAALGTLPLDKLPTPLAPPMPSLASYIERIRSRRDLLELSLKQLQPILEEQLRRVSESAPGAGAVTNPELFVAEIWRQLDASNVISSPKAHRLSVEPILLVKDEVLWSPSHPAGGKIDFFRTDFTLSKRLSAVADLTYRIVLDLANDGYLRLHEASPALSKMNRGARVVDKGLRLYWPFLPFTAPLDAELFNEGWEEVVRDVKVQAESEAIPATGLHTDRLALGFIRLTRDVAGSRLATPRLPAAEKWETTAARLWEETLLSLFTERGSDGRAPVRLRFQGSRLAAYTIWRERVFTMAAPEYRLSATASLSILGVLRRLLSSDVAAPSVKRVIEIRRSALSQGLKGGAGAIAEHDKAIPPDHPWLQFEREFGGG